ncbi:MAG: hypothetical protein IPO21_02290 [Bacteroidales bacterium]|nr:hypothetical protein [Bacteroidales bacterium]
MERIELYNSLLGDIGNFVLVVFGFSVTLFTVLYSFILSKREQLKEYSDKIKYGNNDLLIYQRHSNAIKFIDRFKNFNNHLIATIFIDLFVYLACMIIKYFVENLKFKETSTIVIAILTGIIIVYVSIMLSLTVRDYQRVTKI